MFSSCADQAGADFGSMGFLHYCNPREILPSFWHLSKPENKYSTKGKNMKTLLNSVRIRLDPGATRGQPRIAWVPPIVKTEFARRRADAPRPVCGTARPVTKLPVRNPWTSDEKTFEIIIKHVRKGVRPRKFREARLAGPDGGPGRDGALRPFRPARRFGIVTLGLARHHG